MNSIGPIRWYVGTLATAAAALFVLLFWNLESPIDWIQFAVFLLLFILAESRPVLLKKVRVALTGDFILVMVATIHMAPAAVALASALSVIGLRPEGKWPTPTKFLFNASQSALAGGLAALTYRALGGTSHIDAASLLTILVATTAATGVFFLTSSAAVSGAISITSSSSYWRTWFNNFGWSTATYVAFGAFGVVLAALYQLVDILALPLLLVPLLVARSAFHSYQEVSEAYESTVLAFVGAIEAKDVYTRGHSERVAEYGRMIAERISIRDPDLTVFYYGALLHDVGKLVVRKSILTKPSSLTIEEFNEIKRHPGLGAQIVKDIEFLQPAVEAVLYHHERLDGSGYPAGLSGDLISPWARIMAVADTYDAMTSTRAYRGARTPGEAIEELKRCAGLQLDARCVDALIEALDELEPARARKGYETEVIPGAAG